MLSAVEYEFHIYGLTTQLIFCLVLCFLSEIFARLENSFLMFVSFKFTLVMRKSQPEHFMTITVISSIESYESLCFNLGLHVYLSKYHSEGSGCIPRKVPIVALYFIDWFLAHSMALCLIFFI